MHKLIFYPVGNGDTSQIVLANGKRLLFDFRHQAGSECGDSPCIDLKARLLKELDGRDYFDVVAFTHADKDHISHSTEFFELEHRADYQGEGRIKIRELWVPAAMVVENATRDEQGSEFVLWRQEARHRLKEGRGLRVFSKPEAVKDWLGQCDLDIDACRHLFTDAGTLVPGFSLAVDEVEFFCHSPFIRHVDEGDDLRNDASLIFQVRFAPSGVRTNYLAVGDSTCEVLGDIVRITEEHGRSDRLDWDIFSIPHHCSYLALAPAGQKGSTETQPTPLMEKLLLHGQPGAYVVSSSNPISDTPVAYEQAQPPHIQAKKAYVRYLNHVGGRKFLVTMEEPDTRRPEPLVFEISSSGCRRTGGTPSGSRIVVSSPAPRAG